MRIKNFALGNGKTSVGIAEFQVNAPAMTSNDSSEDAFNAGDEDAETFWSNCGDFDADDYLEIDLGKSYKVSRVEVTNYYPEEGSQGMMAFDMEYFDGSDWVLIDTYEGTTRHHPFFDITFDTVVKAQKFRLTNFSLGVDRTCVGISDVSFF